MGRAIDLDREMRPVRDTQATVITGGGFIKQVFGWVIHWIIHCGNRKSINGPSATRQTRTARPFSRLQQLVFGNLDDTGFF
jgi:hypothetical protein